VANRLPSTPNVPQPGGPNDLRGVQAYLVNLARSILQDLSEVAKVANQAIYDDGLTQMTKPLRLKEYAKAALPAAASWKAGMVMVTDETGGYTQAFSDGTNWRRVQDRAVVS
jgi:hypothetical protein